MRHPMHRALGLAAGLLMACAAGYARAGGEQTVSIPAAGSAGVAMQGRLCRPRGAEQPRLVIINHGSPPDAAARVHMELTSCGSEAVRWFLERGYAVMLVLRPGYGATGGPWTEGYDGCASADFYRLGLETAAQIQRMVDYAATLPDLDHQHMVLVGQSAGGWGVLAYDSLPHPRVSAFIDMAGGRGGHYRGQPASNCRPQTLVEAAGRYGRSATTPMLWIYTGNDSYFGPELARAMHQSFVEGGGTAELVQPAAYGSDGHHLFFGPRGTALWGPVVERYLAASRPGP